MVTARYFRALSLAAAMALALPCRAQDGDDQEPLRHGHRSVELTFSGGYAQGAGRLRSYADETVVATGPGGAFGLEIGYRATRHASIRGGGSYSMFAPLQAWHVDDPEERIARALSVGFDVDVHPNPEGLVAPWGGLGLGYRLLWAPQPDDALVLEHGPQLLRVSGGVDFVAADGFTLGPWAGADVGLLTWRNESEIDSGVTVFLQLGVRAVLNFESMRQAPPRPVRVAK
jgi:hypothetical protein